MGAAGRQFGAPARSLPTRTARLPLMRLCVHATTIPTSEPRPREQVETPERDRARTAGREGSRRDKQQGGREGSRRDKQQGGREGSRRDKRQAAGGKRRGQSCGGLSAPARKTEARPRQQGRHATSVELSSQSPSSAVRPSRVGQASNLRARAAATAAGREGSLRDKGQAAGGNDGDNHAGGCQPRLGRRRPGLGSGHITPRGRGLQGEPTHGRAHGNLMPRPRQRRALLAIPKLGGPHQPRQPGLRLASRGSGHRRRDVAASRRPRSSCQHLGTSTANECHAHAADKQPQRARRLGAGPEDGGRNRVVAGRKTGHRCRQYFGP
ncbi:hypothetical protein POPTR_008G225301v4 [Populus trichocarpa]|uniref:Uncharacterized protein n=1 Tax=Populus trichocarpa TaxID=3694 RepID=A0ACC0SNK6_POPTR|nr:hypothetical protein POPTR_008G225301v4 [Populus trichocarpa]